MYLLLYAGKFVMISVCPTCARVMTWVKMSGRQTTHGWRCPVHKGRKMWPRSGSFFENSKLPMTKVVGLIWCWANDVPNHRAIMWVEVSEPQVVEWYKVRQICYHNLFKSCSELIQISMRTCMKINSSHRK